MIHLLMSPLGFGVLMLMLRGIAHRFGRRGVVLFCDAALVSCLFLMTPLGANLLVRMVEGASPHAAECVLDPDRQVVLLTGGGVRKPVSTQDFSALTAESSGRLFDLVSSGLLADGRLLLISGGGHGVSESAIVRELAVRLGVPFDRVRIEDRSMSTWENAQRVAQLQPAVSRRIVLVTSALHMNRAVYSFDAQGFDVCPFPVNSVYVPPGGIGYILPQESALLKSDAAIHELIGSLLYRLWWYRR